MSFATSEVLDLKKEIKSLYDNVDMQLASEKADKLYSILEDNDGALRKFFSESFVLMLNNIEGYLQNYKKAKKYLDVIKQKKYSYIETRYNHPVNGIKFFAGVIPYGIDYSDKKEYEYLLKRDQWKLKLEKIKNHYLTGSVEDGSVAINSLNLELYEVKKYLKTAEIKEMNVSIESIVDDIAHIVFLNQIRLSQKPNSSVSSIDNDMLKKYKNKSEPEIYEIIGKAVVDNAKNAYANVKSNLDFRIVEGEVILLPVSNNSKENVKDKKEKNIRFGESVIKSLKQSIYQVLCDPKDRVGKDLITKENIKDVLLVILAKQGITSASLILPIIALTLMVSLKFFCVHLKPSFIKN